MTGFIGPDGWPCEFHESVCGVQLIEHIKDLPGGSDADDADLRRLAAHLFETSELGRRFELPQGRRTSQANSVDEIMALGKEAAKLEKRIRKMHAPAIEAFRSTGFDLLALADELQKLTYQSEYAYHDLDEEESPKGASEKTQAKKVCYAASVAYERITGSKVGFTSAPDTGRISGPWPDFLNKVFKTLNIKASVKAQVRALATDRRKGR